MWYILFDWSRRQYDKLHAHESDLGGIFDSPGLAYDSLLETDWIGRESLQPMTKYTPWWYEANYSINEGDVIRLDKVAIIRVDKLAILFGED